MKLESPIDPRMMFGFALLLILAVLSAIIALGKVEQDTSYGLQIILGSIATLSGGFAQWAFNARADARKNDSSDSDGDHKK